MASVIGSGKKYVPYIQGSGEIDENLFSIGTPTMPIGGRWRRYDDLFRDPEDLLRDVEDFFSDFNFDEYMAEINDILATLKSEGVYGSLPFILAVAGVSLGGFAFLIWWASYESEKAMKKWSNDDNGGDDDDNGGENDGGQEGTIIFEPPAIFIRELLNLFKKLPR